MDIETPNNSSKISFQPMNLSKNQKNNANKLKSIFGFEDDMETEEV